MSSAVLPSAAVSTEYPALSKPRLRKSAMRCSSSTTRKRMLLHHDCRTDLSQSQIGLQGSKQRLATRCKLRVGQYRNRSVDLDFFCQVYPRFAADVRRPLRNAN